MAMKGMSRPSVLLTTTPRTPHGLSESPYSVTSTTPAAHYSPHSEESSVLWHNVPLYGASGCLNFICTAPKGKTGRETHCSAPHPNPDFFPLSHAAPRTIGLLPQTWAYSNGLKSVQGAFAGDQQPMEAIDMNSGKVREEGESYAVHLVGAFLLEDSVSEKVSWKVLVMAADECKDRKEVVKDTSYVEQRLPGMLELVREWLRICRNPSNDPKSLRVGLNGKSAALDMVEHAIAQAHGSWQLFFGLKLTTPSRQSCYTPDLEVSQSLPVKFSRSPRPRSSEEGLPTPTTPSPAPRPKPSMTRAKSFAGNQSSALLASHAALEADRVRRGAVEAGPAQLRGHFGLREADYRGEGGARERARTRSGEGNQIHNQNRSVNAYCDDTEGDILEAEVLYCETPSRNNSARERLQDEDYSTRTPSFSSTSSSPGSRGGRNTERRRRTVSWGHIEMEGQVDVSTDFLRGSTSTRRGDEGILLAEVFEEPSMVNIPIAIEIGPRPTADLPVAEAFGHLRIPSAQVISQGEQRHHRRAPSMGDGQRPHPVWAESGSKSILRSPSFNQPKFLLPEAHRSIAESAHQFG
eukprot:TRINITY_DN8151_c0_g1_i1.p1 TRINITY_DN8151_c0_g1~~TRINITY_DN8151_c0_g1_i1.p1  ORF type:complete len:578 (-),score=49.97 TRINITY_DN8151_c0_g1_i1:271-2004(-)